LTSAAPHLRFSGEQAHEEEGGVATEWIEWFAGIPAWAGVGCLGLSAGIEYVFPPFPGDTVTLAGAVLTAQAGWPWWAVFGALTLGSVAGAWANLGAGRWLAQADGDTWLHRWLARPKVAQRRERLEERFRRHGSAYIALNRFLPAFRALFFVTAGMAGLPTARVLGFAALSAALWNGLIMCAGAAVGYNLDVLTALAKQYSVAVWCVLGAVALVWAVRRWRRTD
jgi:membrane protein DedA with SNARE-associated domain